MTKAFVIIQHTDYDREAYQSPVAIRLVDDESIVSNEVDKMNAALKGSSIGQEYFDYVELPTSGYGVRMTHSSNDEALQSVVFKNKMIFDVPRLQTLYKRDEVLEKTGQSFKDYFFSGTRDWKDLPREKAEELYDEFIASKP